MANTCTIAFPTLSHTCEETTARRSRRICLLMTAIWIMNAFDLSLTPQAHQQGFLVESNPIAHAILPHGPLALTLFKIAMVGVGSCIFLYYRCRFMVECISWMIAGVYLWLCIHWMNCYRLYEIIAANDNYQSTYAMLGMIR